MGGWPSLRLASGRVLLAGVVIMQHRMPMAESAALHVLAGKTHRRAFHQQRAEREHFAAAPVDAMAVANDRFAAFGQQAGELGMGREISRHARGRLGDFIQQSRA